MTIFSKIISGQIPCYKIYEDDLVFAFLDIKPNKLGHTLLVPKQEIADFVDLPPDLLSHLMNVGQKLALAVKQATGSKRTGLMVHGLGVPDHFHLHLVPIFETTDLDSHKAHEELPEKMEEIKNQIIEKLRKINFQSNL